METGNIFPLSKESKQFIVKKSLVKTPKGVYPKSPIYKKKEATKRNKIIVIKHSNPLTEELTPKKLKKSKVEPLEKSEEEHISEFVPKKPIRSKDDLQNYLKSKFPGVKEIPSEPPYSPPKKKVPEPISKSKALISIEPEKQYPIRSSPYIEKLNKTAKNYLESQLNILRNKLRKAKDKYPTINSFAEHLDKIFPKYILQVLQKDFVKYPPESIQDIIDRSILYVETEIIGLASNSSRDDERDIASVIDVQKVIQGDPELKSIFTVKRKKQFMPEPIVKGMTPFNSPISSPQKIKFIPNYAQPSFETGSPINTMKTASTIVGRGRKVVSKPLHFWYT